MLYFTCIRNQKSNFRISRKNRLKDVILLYIIPPFEWPRRKRLPAFTCQGYLLYNLNHPTISELVATPTTTLACHIGRRFSSRTLSNWHSLKPKHSFVVGVTSQDTVVGGVAYVYHLCPKLHRHMHDEWFSHGVPFGTARQLTRIIRQTFTAYVFTAYPIDGKPAISSFKELSLFRGLPNQSLTFEHYKYTKTFLIFQIFVYDMIKNFHLSLSYVQTLNHSRTRT